MCCLEWPAYGLAVTFCVVFCITCRISFVAYPSCLRLGGIFPPLFGLPLLLVLFFGGFVFVLLFLFFSSLLSLFSLSFVFSLSMCLRHWCAYGVPVLPSTMAWHCVVHSLYCITMYYNLWFVAVLLPQLSLYLSINSIMKSRHGHGVCCMSTGRNSS